MRAEDLWETLVSDLKSVTDIPDYIWDSVALLTDTIGAELRSMYLVGGHISYCFLLHRCLRIANELPWRLVRGDIQGNLEALAGGVQPEEPVSAKIWTLLSQGYFMDKLADGVKLLGECPWTTVPAEQ